MMETYLLFDERRWYDVHSLNAFRVLRCQGCNNRGSVAPHSRTCF